MIHDVLASAIIALGGFLIGIARTEIAVSVRHRKARRFWQPFINNGSVTIAIGSHQVLRAYEPSGMVGMGDVEALLRLQRFLVQVFKLDGEKIVVISPEGRAEGDLHRSVVLIGSPDGNDLTKRTLQSIQQSTSSQRKDRLPFEFVTTAGQPNKLRFRSSSKRYRELEAARAQGGDVGRDFGVVARLPNPYAEGTSVLLLAGLYGHGTYAATHVVTEERMVSRLPYRTSQRFACLLFVDVIHSRAEEPKIEEVCEF